MSSVLHWGDVPTWLAGAAALYAGVGASKLLKTERKRDKKSTVREIRSQANQIAGWIKPEVKEKEVGGPYFTASVKVRLSNPSEQPVYDVHLTVFKGEAVLMSENFSVLPPEGKQDMKIPEDHLSKVIPHLPHTIYSVESEARGEAKLVADQFNIEFSFRDTAGIRWSRNLKGMLEMSSNLRVKESKTRRMLEHIRGTRQRKLMQKDGN